MKFFFNIPFFKIKNIIFLLVFSLSVFSSYGVNKKEIFASYINPTKERVQSDFNKIWSSITVNDGIDADEFEKLKSIAACATKHLTLDNRVKLLEHLSKGKLRESYEDLVLDVLKTTPPSDIHKLLIFLSDNFNVFSNLYNKMDNTGGSENNKTRFLTTLYSFWKTSDFSKDTYSGYSYTTSTTPRILGYDDKSKLYRGFSFRDLRFELDSSSKKIKIIGEDPGDLDSQTETLYTYQYHPFQPIAFYTVKNETELTLYGEKNLPAFFFMGMENLKDAQARSAAWSLTFDTTLLITGISQLSTLKNATGIYRSIRGTVLGVEITTSALDIVLSYSQACTNSSTCEKIKRVNFWLQIASLSADVLAQRMLQKSAKEVLKESDIPANVRKELQKLANKVDDVLENAINAFKKDFPSNWKYNKIADDAYEIIDGTGKKWGTFYKDKIVASGRTAKGTRGNPILNKVPLAKNMKYEVDGFIYQTDDLGRVVTTNADLDDIARIRLGNQQIRAVDIKDGIKGSDQGGHIVASRFFGPGEQINMYPQTGTLNQGAWKEMENLWAREMVAGKDVKIQVKAIFEGTSKRPIGFDVDYWIDGKKFNQPFEN